MARFIMRTDENGAIVIDGRAEGYSVMGNPDASSLFSALVNYLRVGDTIEVGDGKSKRSVLTVTEGIDPRF